MNDVLEFPPLADVDTPPAVPAHALTTIAAAAKSVVTIKEAAASHLRAQEATILALVERYRAVALALDTPKGLAAGQAALTEVRENGRFAVQRARDATKDLLNAAKKDVEIEADRLIALIKPTEEHHLDVEPVCTLCHVKRDSMRAAQTHCIRGHAFDSENTYVAANGTRHCKACSKASDARRAPRGSAYWAKVNANRRSNSNG